MQKLERPALRIPVRAGFPPLQVSEPYILITPTYGAGKGTGAVPKQVIRFLNDEKNRSLIRGVIAGGNTNFGSSFCLAGEIVSQKCSVPLLHRFEVLGDKQDVSEVGDILNKLEMEHYDSCR